MSSLFKKNYTIIQIFICAVLSLITPMASDTEYLPISWTVIIIVGIADIAIFLGVYCDEPDGFTDWCILLASPLTVLAVNILFTIVSQLHIIKLKYSTVSLWAMLIYVLIFICVYGISAFFVWLFTFDPDDIKDGLHKFISFKKDKNAYEIR